MQPTPKYGWGICHKGAGMTQRFVGWLSERRAEKILDYGALAILGIIGH